MLLATFFLVSFVLYGLQAVPAGEASISQNVLSKAATDGVHSASIDFTPPLRTAGRHIIDADGQRVKLASINWYGASDVWFVAGGLESRHRNDIAATIRSMGFNSVRFPYSDQMVIDNPIIPPEYIAANLDLLDNYELSRSDASRRGDELHGPRAVDVFNACVKALTDAGLAVIINDHITNAQW